jgi:hypothetical protein
MVKKSGFNFRVPYYVVEHLSHHPKVEGSSLPSAADIVGENGDV